MENRKITAFYNLLDQFFEDLIYTFPEKEVKIRTYSNTVSTIKKVNSRGIIEKFAICVGEYQQQILNKDESFFLDKPINDYGFDETSLVDGLELKELWNDPSTTPQIKDSIWQYIQQLLTLSAKVILPQELIENGRT